MRDNKFKINKANNHVTWLFLINEIISTVGITQEMRIYLLNCGSPCAQ